MSEEGGIDKIFNEMRTSSSLEVFDNEQFFGVAVRFSEKDFGFGEIVLSVNKKTGEASFDNEAMSMEHCADILKRAIGTTVVRSGHDTGDEG